MVQGKEGCLWVSWDGQAQVYPKFLCLGGGVILADTTGAVKNPDGAAVYFGRTVWMWRTRSAASLDSCGGADMVTIHSSKSTHYLGSGKN